MTQKRKNSKREQRLSQLSTTPEDSSLNDLKNYLTFSLYYFDGSQKCGQNINDWSKKQQEDLFNCIKNYCGNDKKFWLNQRMGSGSIPVLSIYDTFPTNTDFKCPKNIPNNISWARFRLNNMVRVVGFFFKEEEALARNLSTNVFYIVFLDRDHRFYKTEKK